MLRAAAPLVIVAALSLVFHRPLLTRLALWLHDVDEPESADVIVVLGVESGYRVARAAQLLTAGFAPRMVIVGPDPAYPAWEDPPVEQWLDLAVRYGAPREAIDVVTPAETTLEATRAAAGYLDRHGFKRVLLVTDCYETRRAGWLMRRQISDPSGEVLVVDADRRWFEPTRWWRDERQMKRVTLEYLKLLHHALFHGVSGPVR